MKPEIKNQWVAALRSGEYQQGTGWLRNGDKFCCLGVLCDLHSKPTLLVWRPVPNDRTFTYLGYGGVLAAPVKKWAGIDDLETTELLIRLNDKGTPFAKIADIIEEKL